MPRKAKFNKEDIINAAFSVVRRKGAKALSTRCVAKKLKSSTMPIYSVMKSKENLNDHLVKKALEICQDYEEKIYTGDIFLDMGIGFVLFAKNEKHLFRFTYDEQHIEAHKKHIDLMITRRIEMLRNYPPLKQLDDAGIGHFLLQGFTYSFGLAHLVNCGWYKDLEEKALIDLVEYTGKRYIEGEKLLFGK